MLCDGHRLGHPRYLAQRAAHISRYRRLYLCGSRRSTQKHGRPLHVKQGHTREVLKSARARSFRDLWFSVSLARENITLRGAFGECSGANVLTHADLSFSALRTGRPSAQLLPSPEGKVATYDYKEKSRRFFSQRASFVESGASDNARSYCVSTSGSEESAE